MRLLDILAFLCIAVMLAAALWTTVRSSGNETATATFRVIAQKHDSGRVDFGFERFDHHDQWTDYEYAGSLPAAAAVGRYASHPLAISATAYPEGEQVAALRHDYFTNLSVPLRVSDYDEGWYRISVTTTGNCALVTIRQGGYARVHYLPQVTAEPVTTYRVVLISKTTAYTSPDIVWRSGQGKFVLDARGCDSAVWSIEQLDWPAYR